MEEGHALLRACHESWRGDGVGVIQRLAGPHPLRWCGDDQRVHISCTSASLAP